MASSWRFTDEKTRRYTQGGRVTGQIQSITGNNQDTLSEEVQSHLQEFPNLPGHVRSNL